MSCRRSGALQSTHAAIGKMGRGAFDVFIVLRFRIQQSDSSLPLKGNDSQI